MASVVDYIDWPGILCLTPMSSIGYPILLSNKGGPKRFSWDRLSRELISIIKFIRNYYFCYIFA